MNPVLSQADNLYEYPAQELASQLLYLRREDVEERGLEAVGHRSSAQTWRGLELATFSET